MPSFALITEGITDQVVLDSILGGYYNDDLDIQVIQPARDATDEARQGDFGGFEKVLEYCSLPAFVDIFSYNEFLIIQLDTDIGQHTKIGISFAKDGVEKKTEELILEFRKLIISKITADIYERFSARILFAIAIHSIECWLLPLHAKSKDVARKIVQCEEALKRVVERNNLKFAKDYHGYQSLSKGFSKRKVLDECGLLNESLAIFLKSLPSN